MTSLEQKYIRELTNNAIIKFMNICTYLFTFIQTFTKA